MDAYELRGCDNRSRIGNGYGEGMTWHRIENRSKGALRVIGMLISLDDIDTGVDGIDATKMKTRDWVWKLECIEIFLKEP